MKNEKNYMGFRIPKVWQILKRFAGAFRWAHTYLLFLKSEQLATMKYFKLCPKLTISMLSMG